MIFCVAASSTGKLRISFSEFSPRTVRVFSSGETLKTSWPSGETGKLLPNAGDVSTIRCGLDRFSRSHNLTPPAKLEVKSSLSFAKRGTVVRGNGIGIFLALDCAAFGYGQSC